MRYRDYGVDLDRLCRIACDTARVEAIKIIKEEYKMELRRIVLREPFGQSLLANLLTPNNNFSNR